MIDSSLDGLSQSVEQKCARIPTLEDHLDLQSLQRKPCMTDCVHRKKAVSSQSQELEALEARLRETEERLRQKQSRTSSPSSLNSGRNTPHRRQAIGRAFSEQRSEKEQAIATSPLATQPVASQSRPPTGKAPSYSVPPMPGAMPQTPGETGTSDYVMVDEDGAQQRGKTSVNGFNQKDRENVARQPTRRPPSQPAK